ncbi:hypothetical protein C8J57DRAFT_1285576 [Mycena rebaudengoi]|nr:hypothetical protein C8J57DRAFT_1285576 [Mycena rebaudengoi]
MPAVCTECGGSTVHDDAGAVCTNCGLLVDSTHYELASDVYTSTNNDVWAPLAPKALKNTRGHHFSDNNKEARFSRNLDDMRWFIKSLASAAFIPGNSERAYNLFEKAMKTNKYRWGGTAKLVAGACLAIANRETSRPEMFTALAALLGRKLTLLTRAFTSVVTALELALPKSESKSHISTLYAHVSAAFDGSSESTLPDALVATLKPLPTNTILATATSLSDLLASADPPSDLTRLPAPPTACAVLMVAVEAELRTSLNSLGELAEFLGSRCNVKRAAVMGRYKLIQDEILERIEKISWLDKYEPNSGKSGRAKTARRVVIARGLKDVIERERTRRRRALNGGQPPRHSDSESDSDDGPANPDSRPRKRRKLHALREATQFLLNPLSGSLPVSFSRPSAASRFAPGLPLPTYLLTIPRLDQLQLLPTRLQLLSVARGGGGVEEIPDDELFEDGEMEKLMRSDAEVAELRKVLGWEAGVDEIPKDPPPPRRPRPLKLFGKPTSSSKLLPAHVACYFAEEAGHENFDDLIKFDSDDPNIIIEPDGDGDVFLGVDRALVPLEDDKGEEEWCSDEERYAQECD